MIDRIIVRSIFHTIRKEVISNGYYPNVPTYGNTPSELTRFNNDLNTIRNNKGFYIETFSESSARNKGKKDAPRIVVVLGRNLGGNIGSAPQGIYPGSGPNTYTSGSLPSLASNIMVEVYLIAGNSEQHYTVNAIKDLALGERKFIEVYDDTLNIAPFLLIQSGFYDLDDPMESIVERCYVYTIPDVFRGTLKVDRTNIQPIKEINVDIEPEQDNIHIS